MLDFLKQNSELLNMNTTHVVLLLITLTTTFIIKRYKPTIFYKIFNRPRLKFEVPVYTGILVVLVLLNVIDNIEPFVYFLYFMLLIPYIILSKCNGSTKVYLMLIYNICYFISTHIIPFFSIQENEIWVYILLIVCINILVLMFKRNQVIFILLFLSIFNFFVLGLHSILHAVDLTIVPLYIKFGFILLLMLFYIMMFLVYVLVTQFYYASKFKVICSRINNINRGHLFLVILVLVLISTSLRYIYLYNIFVYEILHYFEVIVLLDGTKNPHHDWVCGPGLKNLFGSHCRKMSSMLIYKQHQHAQMNQLYHEIQTIKKDVIRNQIPPAAISNVHEASDKKTPMNIVYDVIHKHRLRHYACLVEKNDGSKCVTFVTHSNAVDGRETLNLYEKSTESKITSTGIAIDKQYESDVLSNIKSMQDSETEKLNIKLQENTKAYNEEIAEKVCINEKMTMSSMIEKATSEDIPDVEKKLTDIKHRIKSYKQNDSNSEVD